MVVADPQCTTGPTYTGGDADNNNLLDLRVVWTYTCLVANVTSDFTNIASVTATDPTGATLIKVQAVLDIAFREDESRLRKDFGPTNFAILRHIALNLLKPEPSLKLGIKNKRLNAGWHHDYLLTIL